MEALEIGIITAMGCILFLSLFGNLTLCIVVHGQLSFQSVRNYSYLILNLAVSDILLACSSIPFDIVERLKAPAFPFGSTMCKLLWPFQTVCSMASIFTVGALSYQRYRLVVKPFKGKLPRRLFLIMLASIWLLPVFLAGVPYSFVLRFNGSNNCSSCNEQWVPPTKQDQMKLGFTIYLFIIQYVLPLGLIVWCNVKAIVKLKRYLKYRRRTSIICTLSIEHHENTVKMLTAIMAIFALFWLPGQVMHLLLEFQRDNKFILNYGLDIGYLFVFTNCVMNPLVFAYFTRCHKNLPMLRKITSTTSTIACELGYSTFRRESEPMITRRGSLPSAGSTKRPLSKTIQRPSLPILLQSETLTEEQRKDLLLTGKTDTIRNGSKSPRKRKLPILPEISDLYHPVQNGDFPPVFDTPDLVVTQSKDLPAVTKLSTLEFATPKQNSFLQANNQNSGQRKNTGKRLSFSIQHQAPTLNNNDPEFENLQSVIQSDERPKRTSLSSILKKRDSFPGPHGDIEAGNRVMGSFIEVMKTMKEDVLRKYLDATPETVLK